jgi:hypothetical protein
LEIRDTAGWKPALRAPAACARAATVSLVLLALWLAALPARTQTVVLELRNGDRLSGTILTENTNRVVLSNAWSREMILPSDQIVRRTLLAPGSLTQPPSLQEATPATNPGFTSSNSVLSTHNGGPSGANATNGALQAQPPVHWTGEAQVGLDVLQNTKSRQVYYGRAKLSYVQDQLKNVLDFSGSYGRTEGIVDANYAKAINKTDVEVGSQWYLYNLAGVGYDEVRKVNLGFEIGPGLGYHAVKQPSFVVNTEGGFDYQAEEFSYGSHQDRFFGRLAENGSWKFNKKFSFDHRFEFFPSLQESGQFRLRGEASLRYWLWNNLALNLSVVDAYDTTPARNVPPNDLQIRSSLAFKF